MIRRRPQSLILLALIAALPALSSFALAANEEDADILTAPMEPLPSIEGETSNLSEELSEVPVGEVGPEIAAPQPAPASTQRTETTFEATRRGYQYVRPEWATAWTFSGNAFTNASTVPTLENHLIRSFRVQIEYQPTFVQSIGVIGIGPSLSLYPYSKSNDILLPVYRIWSLGTQFRYQAKFFREQIVVPFAGFAFEQVIYHLTDLSGRVPLSGAFFGLMLLLNPFEPDAAGEAYVASGISRSYLVAELRSASGQDANVTLASSSLSLGFRVEF